MMQIIWFSLPLNQEALRMKEISYENIEDAEMGSQATSFVYQKH